MQGNLGNMGGAHTIVTQHSQLKPGRLLGQSYYSSWFYKSPRGFLTRQARLTYATNIGLNFRFLFRIQKNSYFSLDEICSIIKIGKFPQNIRVINKIPTKTSNGYDYDYKLISTFYFQAIRWFLSKGCGG